MHTSARLGYEIFEVNADIGTSLRLLGLILALSVDFECTCIPCEVGISVANATRACPYGDNHLVGYRHLVILGEAGTNHVGLGDIERIFRSFGHNRSILILGFVDKVDHAAITRFPVGIYVPYGLFVAVGIVVVHLHDRTFVHVVVGISGGADTLQAAVRLDYGINYLAGCGSVVEADTIYEVVDTLARPIVPCNHHGAESVTLTDGITDFREIDIRVYRRRLNGSSDIRPPRGVRGICSGIFVRNNHGDITLDALRKVEP